MIATARALKPRRVLEKFGSMKVALEKVNSKAKLRRFKVREFEPNVTFEFERGHYIVKMAENGAELEECLKLRFEVFHREYLKKKRTVGVDIDKLDDVCDHLMIRDRRSNRVIGTYRLNCSKFTDTFYSTSEFQMEKLLALPGTKLELGRACIDKDHRNGVIVALLWRGIAEYIQRTETKLMFGCGSIKTMDPLEAGLITKYLTDEGMLTKEFGVAPTRKFKMRQLDRVMEYIESNPFVYDKAEISKMIPALFNSYIKMNAKLAGEPALDRDFRCIDFLIVLPTDEMTAVFKDKYKV
jgi:putative hemolysin